MKLWQLFKHEVKQATSSPYKKVVILAVIIIPILYSSLFLKAFWDPTGQTKDIKVAVVNQDNGYEVDGENVNIGDELITSLKKNNDLAWTFVSEEDANKGLANKEYYTSLTIPADFSAKIYSVDGSNPEKAELIFRSREATNYLANTITSNASTIVTDTLSHQIIAKYFNNIFASITKSATDLASAEAAADLLTNGLNTASYGSNQLAAGLLTANDGSNQLVSGLTSLTVGQTSLTNGLGEAITGTNTLLYGAKSVSVGMSQISAGLTSTSTGLSGVSNGIGQSQTALTQASSILSAYLAAHPEAATDLGVASQLVVGANNGLTQTKTGVAQLSAGVTSLGSGIGAASVGETQVIDGLTILSSKLSIAKSGASDLSNGGSSLLTGATSLNTGLTSLSDGASTLSNGLVSASDGMTQLRDGLADGVSEAKASTSSEKVAAEVAVMSAPVTLTKNSYDKVANYGSGFAPYFMMLSLWVGGLITFYAIDFTKKPTSRKVVFAKYMTLAVVGILQAVATAYIVQNAVGLSVVNVWQYYAFMILVSLTFMSFLQLLIQHFGDLGRYASIILLILQLTSAAGTFPLETLPTIFKVVNPLLPMTYGVQGLREIIFTSELSNLTVPIVYFVALLVCSLTVNLILTKKHSAKAIEKAI